MEKMQSLVRIFPTYVDNGMKIAKQEKCFTRIEREYLVNIVNTPGNIFLKYVPG